MKYVLMFILIFPAFRVFADDTSFSTRGGGNTDAAEFYQLGKEMLATLMPKSPIKVFERKVDIKLLKANLENTIITVVETGLSLDESSVDAINYSYENRIELNGMTWQLLSIEKKRRLILHEMLGLAGISDPHYSVSDELSKKERSLRLDAEGSLCPEARTITGIEAFALYNLLLKDSSPNSISSGQNFNCVSNPTLKSAYCLNQKSTATNSAESEVLLAMLKTIGVEMISPNGLTEIYSVKSAVCIPFSNPYSYQCMIIAKWKSGCPK